MDSVESTAATAALAPNSTAPDPATAIDDEYDAVPEVAACISSMIDRAGSVGSHDENHRLFLARRTVLEILRDRGYSVPEDELTRTLPEFRAWWADKPELERLAFSTILASDPSSKAKVLFCPPEPVKIAVIQEVYNRVKDENLSRLILILQSKIMAEARESIEEIFPFKVDIFQITELLVNITKHVLKPKHEVLTAEEKAKLLKEYNVVDSQVFFQENGKELRGAKAQELMYAKSMAVLDKEKDDKDLRDNRVWEPTNAKKEALLAKELAYENKYAAVINELEVKAEKKLWDELHRKDVEIQLQIKKTQIAEANLNETCKWLKDTQVRELMHARKAAILAKELKDEKIRHAAAMNDLQVQAEQKLEELQRKICQDKESNRHIDRTQELAKAELTCVNAELSTMVSVDEGIYKQSKLVRFPSDSAVIQGIELPVQPDRDKEIYNIRRNINELEIAHAKLLHELIDAKDRLKKLSRSCVLETVPPSTGVIKLKKQFKFDGSLELDFDLAIARCHDVFLCPYEVSHMTLREYLADPESKIFRVRKVPGKSVVGHVSKNQFEQNRYIIPPRRKLIPPEDDLRKMSSMGKFVIAGIIDCPYKLQRYGLSLNGKFDLDSFHLTVNKKIKLDPALKSLLCIRSPSNMSTDYTRIPSVIEQILSLYDDSSPIPFDLKYLLDLLGCEDPVAKEVIIRYNVSLMDEILKRDHFIILYNRLQQVDKEDEQMGKPNSRSNKVMKFITAAKDLYWRDKLHSNEFIAMVRDRHKFGSTDFDVIGSNEVEARKLLKTWRHNFTHLHEVSAEVQDKDEADILDSVISGVINEFQEGMHSIGEIDIPHLVATMKA